ncbi:MAG: 4-(cytidine 5'-diphospho)-2-C-methyl-D-erythritol kinase [Lachnospiraceae bacterium]|nr:4-(cytidine 5'-diphospho)-2-C-methyl-D-erythritol kinase [Lachnospiraceae bacterium]
MDIKAYAKINLGLDITGKRDDGYHDLRMIMQQIDLYDVVSIEAEPEIAGNEELGKINLTCSDGSLPLGEENLAYKAAKLLFEEFKITDSIDIHIDKKIPVAAGLAGGSADAAAVLKGINEYFGLGLSDEELMERGVKLGADIPFCIMGGLAYAGGIGEELMPLGFIEGLTVLLAVPDISVSTKWAYETYDEIDAGSIIHPDIDNLRAAIEMEDYGCVPEFLGNVLEYVAIPQHPEIAKIKDIMMSNGAAGALMSGSGPSVYGLFVDMEKAARVFDILADDGTVPEDRIYLLGFAGD